ncbi:PTS transporter subunit EIIC [Alicyclobacillus fastidiosus]|uniref:PTS transporter subunit EIIC n=1 Tax=Alicyclobacillus fastidiosus TaxID=392011 RepID=A0ABV5AG83_9BACL|nr:PTS transporter subunit EIIC [Alicyclobacillus fastidiosus]WEH08913.1 PTS transporter subunit EIIC [Alicyclobacillus fastidiosus]
MQTKLGLGKVVGLMAVVFAIGAILYWLGGPSAANVTFIQAVGYAILSNYAIILAVGISIGMAKENQGAAALAAFLGFEVIVQGANSLTSSIDIGDKGSIVLVAGLIAGVLAGYMYNRYHKTKLPAVLAFFGGRRFVPIITAGACLLIAFVLGHIWH